MLDGDTHVSPDSGEAARRAVGALCAAVDAVVGKETDNAFCAVRPPGHHAEQSIPMGFCVFNSVAAGAEHARQQHGMERAAVVDFDVHHGNGTEEIARHWIAKRRVTGEHRRRGSPDLFFASIHLADDGTSSGINFYPGTGVRDDLVNNIVNVVVPPMWLRHRGYTGLVHAPTLGVPPAIGPDAISPTRDDSPPT